MGPVDASAPSPQLRGGRHSVLRHRGHLQLAPRHRRGSSETRLEEPDGAWMRPLRAQPWLLPARLTTRRKMVSVL